MITLNDFVRKIDDLESQVILLAGKRVVAPEDEIKLVRLGELLAKWLPDCKFRSGNARGSDELFIKGVCKVDRECVELILPFKGHRPETAKNLYALSLDDFDLAAEPEAVYQTRNITNMQMVDSYMDGVRDRFAINASYLIRDNIMVIGSAILGLKKADFGIFYHDSEKPMLGGTGHTMRFCTLNHVPFVDQQTWMRWLE
jgi:hypothetical protein